MYPQKLEMQGCGIVTACKRFCSLEINRELVRQGWARNYREFTMTDDEADAERRKGDLWMSDFDAEEVAKGEGRAAG